MKLTRTSESKNVYINKIEHFVMVIKRKTLYRNINKNKSFKMFITMKLCRHVFLLPAMVCPFWFDTNTFRTLKDNLTSTKSHA